MVLVFNVDSVLLKLKLDLETTLLTFVDTIGCSLTVSVGPVKNPAVEAVVTNENGEEPNKLEVLDAVKTDTGTDDATLISA